MANQAVASFAFQFVSDGSSTTGTFDLTSCLVSWASVAVFSPVSTSNPNAKESTGVDAASTTVQPNGGSSQPVTSASINKGLLTIAFATALPAGTSICQGRLFF